MMMLLAPLLPSQLLRGIKSQFFTPRREGAYHAGVTPDTDVYEGGPLYGPRREGGAYRSVSEGTGKHAFPDAIRERGPSSKNIT